MSSYRQHLYHLLIRIKDSAPTISQDDVGQLYSYILGIRKNKKTFEEEYRGLILESGLEIDEKFFP